MGRLVTVLICTSLYDCDDRGPGSRRRCEPLTVVPKPRSTDSPTRASMGIASSWTGKSRCKPRIGKMRPRQPRTRLANDESNNMALGSDGNELTQTVGEQPTGQSPEDRAIAFTTAVRDHRVAIHSVARRLCGDDAAGDVTQDVFMRLWRNPNGFDPSRGTMRQYVSTLARGAAIDHLRRRTAQRTNDQRTAADASGPAFGTEQLLDAESRARIIAGVGSLPATERDAIAAAFFLHLTDREVAVSLGIAEGTAKSRIRSGLTRLRTELDDVHLLLFP